MPRHTTTDDMYSSPPVVVPITENNGSFLALIKSINLQIKVQSLWTSKLQNAQGIDFDKFIVVSSTFTQI